MKNKKKIMLSIISTILVILGLCCIFAHPLRNIAIKNNTQHALNEKIVKHDPHPKYDTKLNPVSNIPPKNNVHPIGILSIPSIGIKLPIFEGLNNAKMEEGVCTIEPNRVLGENNNVVIAGHHLENQQLLLGRLTNIKKGALIKITNSQQHMYVYQVDQTMVVYENDTAILNNTLNEKRLTLFTCNTGTPGTPYRFVAISHLIK